MTGNYIPKRQRRTNLNFDGVPFRPHSWVEVGEEIFDLTETQFNRKAEPVSIHKVDDPRYSRWSYLTEDGARAHIAVGQMEDDLKWIATRAVVLIGVLNERLAA